VVEVYALCTDWRRTLSAAVWSIEDFLPDQKVSAWTVGHYWFTAIFGCTALWLFFHFSMGWWRG